MNNLIKSKKSKENKPEHVLSYYDEETSRNETSASRENAGAELDVCTGSMQLGAPPMGARKMHFFTPVSLSGSSCDLAMTDAASAEMGGVVVLTTSLDERHPAANVTMFCLTPSSNAFFQLLTCFPTCFPTCFLFFSNFSKTIF